MSRNTRFTPAVEILDHRVLPAVFTVVTDADGGAGSLRQAILDANATLGADVIRFQLPAGHTVIRPNSSGLGVLPSLTDAVLIDGWSQGGYGYSGAPLAAIDGGIGGVNVGLSILADGVTIRGLEVRNFGGVAVGGYGVIIGGSSSDRNAWLYGNRITGNGHSGVWAQGNAHGNRIGTNADGMNDDAETNVISGNGVSGLTGVGINVGVRLDSNGNVVAGNRIGVSADGTARDGNMDQGVFVTGANNRIGGTRPGSANAIAANGGSGVQLHGPNAKGNRVEANFLGTNSVDDAGLGNTANGVRVSGAANGNTISANVIAFNAQPGVALYNSGTVSNRLSGNRIFANTGLGIDIFANGVTPNDADDADTGPNQVQNSPVLAAASSDRGLTTITGSLTSTASTRFRVEFFADLTPDPTGYGEAESYLGAADVTTDAAGHASFRVTLSVSLLTHQWVTATATDPAGNTSELSSSVREDDPSVARADIFSVLEDRSLTAPAEAGILANDTDADGDAPVIESFTTPANAAAFQLLADGSFTYTPRPGFSGSDSFRYSLAGGATAVVFLTVHPVNDAPQAAADDYRVTENGSLSVPVARGLLANDHDEDSPGLSVALLAGPLHGTLTLRPDGSFVYVPVKHFHGVDRFAYRVSDGAGGFDVTTVTLSVAPWKSAAEVAALRARALRFVKVNTRSVHVLSLADANRDGVTDIVERRWNGRAWRMSVLNGLDLTLMPPAYWEGPLKALAAQVLSGYGPPPVARRGR